MTKSNHKVPIVRITELLKHPNADSLSIVRIGGYQCVVKTDNFKIGDLAVYVQPDSVVPQTEPFRFIWEGRQEEPDGQVREKYRRITVRKFRKEWGEGLLLPLTDFVYLDDLWDANVLSGFEEGEDVSELLGITHYEPPEPEDRSVVRKQQYKWPPKSLRGWFYYLLHLIGIDLNGPTGGANEKGPKNPPPVYDVEAYKNFVGAFEPDEQVVVTEKLHGSNARFTFDGNKMFVGSRQLWKSENSKCVWRRALAQNPWIEEWCRKFPGCTLYGEVFPTQKDFNYGTENGQVGFRAFDVLNAEGEWVPVYELADTEAMVLHTVNIPNTWVPVLYSGPFEESKIKPLVEGQSQIPGAKHIREGVVVRPAKERHVRGLGRLQLKIVSNKFLEVS